jgi:hypothetical protein
MSFMPWSLNQRLVGCYGEQKNLGPCLESSSYSPIVLLTLQTGTPALTKMSNTKVTHLTLHKRKFLVNT